MSDRFGIYVDPSVHHSNAQVKVGYKNSTVTIDMALNQYRHDGIEPKPEALPNFDVYFEKEQGRPRYTDSELEALVRRKIRVKHLGSGTFDGVLENKAKDPLPALSDQPQVFPWVLRLPDGSTYEFHPSQRGVLIFLLPDEVVKLSETPAQPFARRLAPPR